MQRKYPDFGRVYFKRLENALKHNRGRAGVLKRHQAAVVKIDHYKIEGEWGRSLEKEILLPSLHSVCSEWDKIQIYRGITQKERPHDRVLRKPDTLAWTGNHKSSKTKQRTLLNS